MFILSAAVLLSACDDKEDENDTDEGSICMAGKINGVSFSWTDGTALLAGDVLELTAKGGVMVPRISLYVPADVAVGSYSITRYGDFQAFHMNNEGVQIYVVENDGMITITEHNKTKKTIKGTFHFSTSAGTHVPAYSVTDGSFSYAYEILF